MRTRTLTLIAGLLITAFALTAGADHPAKPGFSEQANFCQGTYALCIKAPCSPIPTTSRLTNYEIDHALCSCEVVEGWSMGPGQCADRAPVAEGGRTYLVSTYSNRFNASNATLACNDDSTLWAWCYGAPCVVDAADPSKAVCTCPVDVGPARTLGGDCKPKACGLIWSAATPSGDAFANRHFYDWMQQNHPKVPANGPAPACSDAPSGGIETMDGSAEKTGAMRSGGLGSLR